MKTLTNLNSQIVNLVFNMTNFNYETFYKCNGDGTENVQFDSIEDCNKFESLYNELN